MPKAARQVDLPQTKWPHDWARQTERSHLEDHTPASREETRAKSCRFVLIWVVDSRCQSKKPDMKRTQADRRKRDESNDPSWSSWELCDCEARRWTLWELGGSDRTFVGWQLKRPAKMVDRSVQIDLALRSCWIEFQIEAWLHPIRPNLTVPNPRLRFLPKCALDRIESRLCMESNCCQNDWRLDEASSFWF